MPTRCALSDVPTSRSRSPTTGPLARAGRSCSARSGRRRAPSTYVTARRAAARSTCTSTSTGTHDEHLLSMAFPLDVRADVGALRHPVRHTSRRPTHPSQPVGRRQVRGVRPPLRRRRPSPPSASPCSTTAATATACSTAPSASAWRGPRSIPIPTRTTAGTRDDRRAAARRRSGARARRGRPAELARARDRSRRRRRCDRAGTGARRPPVVSVLGHSSGASAGVQIDAVKQADDGSGDLSCASTRRSGTGRRSTCGPIGGWSRRGSATCSRSRPGRSEVGDGHRGA